jgi:hypothetical protein
MQVSKIKKTILGLLVLAVVGWGMLPLQAAAETVTGTVQNGDTDAPLQNVLVEIYDAARTTLLGSANTTADGSFSVAAVPTGAIAVDFSLTGYVPTFGNYTVSGGVTFPLGTIELAPEPLLAPPNDVGTVSGIVYDATDAVTTIDGVTIELRPGINQTSGAAAHTAVSAGGGTFSIPDVAPGTYTLLSGNIVGFYNTTQTVVAVEGTDQSYTVLLSPVLISGQIRIVLTWSNHSSDPPDLDSHLYTPEISGVTYEVFYGNTGSNTVAPLASLDVDDRDWGGPETITIHTSFDGTYQYRVHQYPWPGGGGYPADTGYLWRSDAVVQVYDSGGLRFTFNVPPLAYLTEDRWWHVFDYTYDSATGTGRITPVDGYYSYAGLDGGGDSGPGSSPCFIGSTTGGEKNR